MKKAYPPGATHTEWFLANDCGTPTIRRKISLPDGRHTQERYDAKQYSHLRDNLPELSDFLVRLNGRDPVEERIKKKLLYNHAYISEQFLYDYQHNYLNVQIPNRKDATTMFQYLKKHALDFFIHGMKLPNPLDWHRNQDIWGKYLLNKEETRLDPGLRIFASGEVRSSKVLKQTIYELNRFARYLHLKRPTEVPPLLFQPLTRAAFKEIEGRRELLAQVRTSKYITPADWKKISSTLDLRGEPWRFVVYLAYYYGLRRNEAMGLKLQDIRKAYLSVERQFVDLDSSGLPVYGPLKNRTTRKVPHLFVSPAETYSFIQAMQKRYYHPDTVSSYFSALVEELELDGYVFHDSRRAFITNALKTDIKPEDLRLAAGHSNIETTYRYYVMDSRELADQLWVPEAPKLATK